MEERKKIIISIRDLRRMLIWSIPLILCWSLFCGTVLLYYKDSKEPVYTAETSIYILSRTADTDYGRLDMSDLDVSRQMTSDALSILASEQVAEKTLVNLSGDATPLQTMNAGSLLNMLDIRHSDDSLEITIAVTGPDPYIVCDIANTYRETAIRELNDRIMAKGIQTLKEAVIPLTTSGRPTSFFGAAGFVLGLISSVGLLIVYYVLRHAERETEDVEEI